MKISLDDFQKQIEKLDFATGDEAKKRFEYYSDYDPYPEIPATLLHAGHIASYVSATGLIDPFDKSELKKPATYLVPLEGQVTYREEDGSIANFFLSHDREYSNFKGEVRQSFILKPNMLCFVTLKPNFRIPNYIACRFNLQIRDVYRGLLVGTGPLVDPGFFGKISIPVHNFTSSEYVLNADEGFVYFEFTKTAWSNGLTKKKQESWVGDVINDQPPFPKIKIDERRTLTDYLPEKKPPQSTLSAELLNFKTLSEENRKQLDAVKTQSRWISIGATIGVLFTMLSIGYTTWQLIVSAQQFVQATQLDVSTKLEKIEAENASIKQKLNTAETK